MGALRRPWLLAVCLASLVTACTGDGSDGTPEPNGGTEGKTLVVAGVTTPPTLDLEYTTGTPQSWEIADQIYDSKAAYPVVGDERDFSSLEPRLLESWESNADGTVWTLHVRQGVMNHLGHEMTADDLKWSFDRAFGLNAVGTFFTAWYNLTDANNVRVMDKYTIEITLDAYSPVFESTMAIVWMPFYDSQEIMKHATPEDPWATEFLAANAVGYGPYYLEELVAGQRVVLKANPNYYLGKPEIDTIIYNAVPESANRTALVSTGDVDVALALSAEELNQLEQGSDVEVTSFTGNSILALIPNEAVPPLDNVKVRQAMAYAIPYDQILDDIFQGWAEPIHSYVAPQFPGYTDEFFPYHTDLDRARALIEESGVETPIRLTVTYGQFRPEIERMVIAIRSSFAEVGIELTLNLVTPAEFGEISFGRDFEMIVPSALQSHVFDSVFSMWQFSGHGQRGLLNYGNYDNQEVYDLFDQTNLERDPANRLSIVEDIQEEMAADPPWLVIGVTRFAVAHTPNVTGFVWAPDEALRFVELGIE